MSGNTGVVNHRIGQGTVEFVVDGAIGIIWLNRPQSLNAVTPNLIDDLLAAVITAEHSAARVLILAGRGRAFCAGHDLKEPPPQGDSRARLEKLQEITRKLRALPQPVIAAIQGYAIGAGVEFALGCDLIIAEETALFAFPEVSLGLSVTGAASRLLPLLVGAAKAKELVLLGERIDATTARQLGLINLVTPVGELMPHALQWAEKLAKNPTFAMTIAKQALNAAADGSVETALELEITHALATEHSAEVVQSSDAFRNRHE